LLSLRIRSVAIRASTKSLRRSHRSEVEVTQVGLDSVEQIFFRIKPIDTPP
jgi:hypothetical protein